MAAETQVGEVQKVPWFPWIGTRKRPFYGWVIVAAGSVENFFQAVANLGFSTYLGPIQQDFGWSRAVLAGPRSVTQIENAILGPLEGILVDKFGPRIVISSGAFLLGCGLIMFGMVQELWQYYVANVVIAIGTGLSGLLVMSVAINHWFSRRRTVAQSIFLLGYATAGMIAIPILVWIQGEFGWRTAAIASGLGVWAVGIPAGLVFRRSPEAYGLLPDGDESPDESSPARRRPAAPFSFTLRQAMRTRTFWLLSCGNGINGLAMSAMMVHLFLHMEQGVGLSRGTAALMWTIASAVNIPSRLVAGVLGDRLPKHMLYAGCVAMMGCSILVLGLARSVPMAVLFAALYGAAWGARTPLLNSLHADYWGLSSLGKIVGTLQSMAIPLSIAGPVLAGVMADSQGNYRLIFVSLSIASFFGAGLIFLARPPKPPPAESDALSSNEAT